MIILARDYAPKTWDGLASQVAKDVYKKVGNTIAKHMTHQFVSVINAFYDDYHPHVYKRKYRAYYYASEDGVRAYTKFVKMDSDNKGFSVCLRIDPMNIRTPYTSIVNGKGSAEINEMVFFNTWVLGQHGGRLPWSAIPENKRVGHPNPNDWESLINNGKSDYYWQPPVMSKSPMQLMDEWFESYATSENLDKLTRNIVTESINRYIRRANSRYGGLK